MGQFPRVALVEQKFPRPKVDSIEDTVESQFREKITDGDWHGKKIAVATGSRGVANIARTVRETIQVLKQLGAEPFIIPAMGSHGGATAEGQSKILKDYGITQESMGVKVRSSMETVKIGETELGIPVYMDKNAFESDGVVVVNRIKAHTDFQGQIESGLMKMITIGLGKKDGANVCHSRTTQYSYDKIIMSVSRHVLQTGKILCGVAILENAYHETAGIEVIPAKEIEEREKQLLPRSKSLMPSLPVDSLDILIVEKIGKNISGTGMDPNIIGRWYNINGRWQEKPDITRIIVMDVTSESAGNAVGIGLADFCSNRVMKKMDRNITYLNAITSRNIINAFTPLTFDTDKEVLIQAQISLGGLITPETIRLIQIKDTMDLSRIVVSEALIPSLQDHPQIASISEPQEIRFDDTGSLMSELT